MRIALIATRSDVFGGAVVHVRDLALGLRDRGYVVRVIIGGEGPMVGHLRDRGIPVSPLRHLRRDIDPRADGRALSELSSMLERFRPDVVHGHTAKAGLLTRVAARRLGIPCVYTPHAWPFLPGVPEPSRSRYLRIERAAARLPGLLIDVCEFERDVALRAGVGREPQHVVIPNGVADTGATGPPTGPTPRLVMVGRFESQKDHDTLLRALARLRNVPWVATLVGDGPTRAGHEATARRLGLGNRISFAGERNDVAAVLAGSDISVLSTNWEGLPLTVLESMRAGVPVVATAVGGVPEAVDHATTGLLVGQRDPAALADALGSLLGDEGLRRRLGAAGRDRYRELFTLEQMIGRTAAVYDRVVTGAPRRTVRHVAAGAARTGIHAGRRATSAVRRGPDFLIIGTQKGGTTSLYRYLLQHPYVAPATSKEVHYFDLNYHRGDAWYRSHFPLGPVGAPGSARITGEASPYYLFHPLVPGRVARDHPAVRLIVLLRDPVARAYSHYQHERSKGREYLTFERAIEAEPRRVSADVEADVRRGGYHHAHRRFSYLARGRYAGQVAAWLELFPREQLLILRSEDLQARTHQTLDVVLRFLGLAGGDVPSVTRHNVRRYPPLDPEVHARLREHFAPHNEELRAVTGDGALTW